MHIQALIIILDVTGCLVGSVYTTNRQGLLLPAPPTVLLTLLLDGNRYP